MVSYCSREQVKSALESVESARNNTQIDDAIESASRDVESQLHRRFYPEIAVRYFDWPNGQYAKSYRLWLEENEALTVSSLVINGNAVTDYLLYPANSTPKTSIELNRGSTFSATFAGTTPQRNVVVTGTFGYCNDTKTAGATAEVLDSIETGVDVTNGAAFGVGDLLIVDSEYMQITGRSFLDTGQDIQADLSDSDADVTVSVTTGSAFTVGELLILDGERMLIDDIAGNNLIVRRAYDGSVLAPHVASSVLASRTLTVVRGVLGTAATTHLTAAPALKHVVPGPVNKLAIAEALNTLLQESGGYSRTVGTPGKSSGGVSQDSSRGAPGGGLDSLRDRVASSHGRQSRTAAV